MAVSDRKSGTSAHRVPLEEIDEEYARHRARLSPERREWLDSVVGCIDTKFEIEADKFVDEVGR